MFGFLKEKLKNAVSKLSSDIAKEAEEITEEVERTAPSEVAHALRPANEFSTPAQQPREEVLKPRVQEVIAEAIKEKEETRKEGKEEEKKEEKKGFFSKLFAKKEEETEATPQPSTKLSTLREPQGAPLETQLKTTKKHEETSAVLKPAEEAVVTIKELEQEKAEEPASVAHTQRPVEKETEENIGFFAKIRETVVSKRLSEDKFEDIFFDLELTLLESNVAVAVIEKIKQDLKDRLVDHKLSRFQIENIILETLKKSLDEILSVTPIDLLQRIEEKRKQNQPYVIAFVGVNGSGKTTTIAKMAKYFQNNNLKPVLVAADTFRAAAIQQLEEHAKKLCVKIIKHDYGSDPAAVAFDGIAYARAKNADVVLIDTAGRLHSNTNLMDEMKKIMRIANPDLKIFIGESITGNDCVEQAQEFNDAVVIDAIVLSKTDVDEKGGAAISVSYVTGKPILFLGSGQTYESLLPFDKEVVLRNLGLT